MDFLSKTTSFEIKEAEKSVLSALFYGYDKNNWIFDIDLIGKEYFVTEEAKKLFQAIKISFGEKKKMDRSFVFEALRDLCKNGQRDLLIRSEKYFFDLYRGAPLNIKNYIELLHNSKKKRDLDELARTIIKSNPKTNQFSDFFSLWNKNFFDIISSIEVTSYLTGKTAVEDFLKTQKQFNDQKVLNNVISIKTGYKSLDDRIKDLGGGKLFVLASRPGIGKTTFSLNILKNNFFKVDIKTEKKEVSIEDLKKIPGIGIFSLEMPSYSIISKLAAISTNIYINCINTWFEGGLFEKSDEMLLKDFLDNLSKKNIFFCDNANITIGKIASTIKVWAKRSDLKLVIIDYLQLISNDVFFEKSDTPQYLKIGRISRELKILAMELDICILALSQLNRKIDDRRWPLNAEPILSDLRESGSIEQDADVVMFLYKKIKKPELPQKNNYSEEVVVESSSNENNPEIFLKIAKNRHGPIGEVKFVFEKTTGIFRSS